MAEAAERVSPVRDDVGPGLDTPAAASIRRRRPNADDASFESLRAEGIRLVQALSGWRWTDFNLHDPGVTILEQLCFALTDLVYRADFQVADHLTGAGGYIEHAQQALHGPAAVFPCRPTTTADYRCALLDTIKTIDNACFTTAETGPDGYRGLYLASVRSSRPLPAAEDERIRVQQDVMRDVAAVYRRNRNLCEDLHAVSVLVPDPCYLHGDFEIGGARPPEDVVAEIFDRCSRAIVGGVVFQSFAEALKAGKTLDRILNPLHTRHGVLADGVPGEAGRDDAARFPDLMSSSALAAQVRMIDGVRLVRYLGISRGADPQGAESELLHWDPQTSPMELQFPGRSKDGSCQDIRVTRAGSDVKVAHKDVAARYSELRTGDRARPHGRQDIATHFPPPRGQHRELQRYTSIKTQFPAIYGIARGGLPASAPHTRKAQAQQLKAYLALFEQILANSAAQVQHLRDLFSNQPVSRTYWWQRIADDTEPDASRRQMPEAPEVPDEHALRGEVFRAGLDRDRRSRALDFLLALHGETYAQNSLRQSLMRYYADPAKLDERLLVNKHLYLKNILAIGRDRAAGYDHSRHCWEEPLDRTANSCGFHLRVSLLLGFIPLHSRPLIPGPGSVVEPTGLAAYRSEGMHVIEHILLRPMHGGPDHGLARVAASFFSLRMTVVFPAWTERCKDDTFQRFAEATVQMNCPGHVDPEFLWLEPSDMKTFERRYGLWLKEKVAVSRAAPDAPSTRDVERLDRASAAVVYFLLNKRHVPVGLSEQHDHA